MESPLDPAPGCSNSDINMGSIYETEGGRGCRNKRRQSNPTFCPVCKCTLRPSDVDQHLNCELEKLQKISKSRFTRQTTAASAAATSGDGSTPSCSNAPAPSLAVPPQVEHYRKYEQVRSNRQSRQKAKCKRRKLNDGSSTSAQHSRPGSRNITNILNVNESSHADLQCPVCNRSKIRTEITMHVERCLNRSERRRKCRSGADAAAAADTAQKQAGPSTGQARDDDAESSADSSTDCDGEDGAADNDEIDVESYEEYEWAGQSRVRVTSMVSGGIASLIAAANIVNDEEVDEDLIVDDDDRFGEPQYTEADTIQCGNSRERKEETLRRAVLSPIVPVPAQQHYNVVPVVRSRSAEPARADEIGEAIKVERLEGRSNSDPVPSSSSYTDNANNGAPVKFEDDSLSVHSLNTDQLGSLVPITPPTPIPTPIDTSLSTNGSGTPSSSPIPVIAYAPALSDHRALAEKPPSASESATVSGASSEGLLRQSSASEPVADLQLSVMLHAVPRLSTIAQDVATKLHVTGPNPTVTLSASYSHQHPVNQLVIQCLFGRIRDLEARLDGDVYKCLICMDRYRKPVISISCWHVHCEECWLRTLGAKKLCPQCNAITTPRDLRKIYI